MAVSAHPLDHAGLPERHKELARLGESSRSGESFSPALLPELYQSMFLIRQFETRILELFAAGELNGTTHTYVGQEANAVALISQLQAKDIVFSSHRCHGHYLARFHDAAPLFAELMGRVSGVCAGRGGSQHLCRDNFFSNGIQGGYVPVATGMALAEKASGSGAIAVAFIGDGTLGEGNVYEAANLASLWDAPLLLVIENNRYAQTTPIELALAGRIADRFKAFDFTVDEVESNDVADLHPICAGAIDRVRSDGRPHALVLNTYRLNAHSKSDDFRDPEEIEAWRKKDPLGFAARGLDDDRRAGIEALVMAHLAEAEDRARGAAEA
jgi:TPP-dependent pyruvate/acetoin dehydrogenase alpha subunit